MVRPEMGRGRHDSSRSGGRDELISAHKRTIQLDADFKVDLIIKIYRHVAACPGNCLGAQSIPYGPARLRNDSGKLRDERSAPNYRKRTTLELLKLDGVFHGQNLRFILSQLAHLRHSRLYRETNPPRQSRRNPQNGNVVRP